jgi:hypothetical protein
LFEDRRPYNKYTPASVLENDNLKLYWNRSIITDKTIPSRLRWSKGSVLTEAVGLFRAKKSSARLPSERK